MRKRPIAVAHADEMKYVVPEISAYKRPFLCTVNIFLKFRHSSFVDRHPVLLREYGQAEYSLKPKVAGRAMCSKCCNNHHLVLCLSAFDR